MTDEPEDEKKVRKDHIQQLYAVNLFCKHKFEESMKLFVELDTGKVIDKHLEFPIFTAWHCVSKEL